MSNLDGVQLGSVPEIDEDLPWDGNDSPDDQFFELVAGSTEIRIKELNEWTTEDLTKLNEIILNELIARRGS